MHAAGLLHRDALRADVRLLGPALVAWAVAALALTWSTRVVVAAALACLLGAVAARRQGHRAPAASRALAAALLLVPLVLAAVLGHRGVALAGSVPELAGERAVVTLTARVASDPRLVAGGAERQPLVLVRLTVLTATGRGETTRTRTPVLAFADRRWLDVHRHELVRVQGRLAPPEPGDDVAATLTIRGAPTVIGRPGPIDRAADEVRARLRTAVQGLPADARGLVPGLVIGDTSLTPEDLTQAMRDTSLTHLSAVSGTNVTVVLAGVLWLCGLAGVPRRARVPIALLGLAGFVVLARPEPSVIRAAVMGSVGLVAVTGGRERQGLPALGSAVVLLLLVDPWLARSYGFALSSLATLGLLLFARPWGEALDRRLPARLVGLGPALAIPVAAQVMCAPVTLLLQPGVSLVGIPANLLAAPFVAPATIAGVAVAGVAVLSPSVAGVLAWVPALPTLAIAQIARRGAQVPFGSLPWPEGARGVVLLVALTVVLVLSGRRLWWAAVTRPLAAGAVVAVVVGSTVPTTVLTWPPGEWALVACDVGQGDGLVLRSGPDRAVVVDVGPRGAGMTGCLDRLGVRALDAVVLTHFHADHVGGLDEVLGALPVARLLVTIAPDPPDQAEMVARVAREHALEQTPVRAGESLELGTVRAEAVWPARVLQEGSVPNNASIVLLAEAGGVRTLLTGDVEREAAHAALLGLRRLGGTRVDVLKVAHHGSSNQDAQLVAEARAPLALVSVGRDNDYGHPAPAALQLLARAGSRVVRTDECGDIAVVRADGALAVACRGP